MTFNHFFVKSQNQIKTKQYENRKVWESTEMQKCETEKGWMTWSLCSFKIIHLINEVDTRTTCKAKNTQTKTTNKQTPVDFSELQLSNPPSTSIQMEVSKWDWNFAYN